MCINFDEYHYDGILLVYVYDFFFYYKNCVSELGP